SRPARYATIRVIVSTAVALLLLRPLGVVGVVLGAAFAGWTELALLARLVRKHVGSLGLGRVPFMRILAASALAVGAGEGIGRILATSLRDSTLGAALVLGVA